MDEAEYNQRMEWMQQALEAFFPDNYRRLTDQQKLEMQLVARNALENAGENVIRGLTFRGDVTLESGKVYSGCDFYDCIVRGSDFYICNSRFRGPRTRIAATGISLVSNIFEQVA